MLRLFLVLNVIIMIAFTIDDIQAIENGKTPKSNELVDVIVDVQDTEGKGVSVGEIYVNLASPEHSKFYLNKNVGANGRCVFHLKPNIYGIRWETKDNLRPVQVKVNGKELEKYPKFVVTHESEDIISGRSLGAEVTVRKEPVQVLFIVPYDIEQNRIVGIVEDGEGNPIPNLQIDLYRNGIMNCSSCADTDDSGKFDFICRKFPVKLIPCGYTGLWKFQPAELSIPGPTRDTLRFLVIPRTSHRLQGVVIDQATGKPIRNLIVEYKQECPNNEIEGKVKTDDSGQFATSCYLECEINLEFWHPEHIYYRREIILPPESFGEFLTIEMTVRE